MVTPDDGAAILLGLACGDALGRPVEFRSAEWIADHGPVNEMQGYGTHGQPAGTVTDDTDLAMCIARSLVEHGRFDGADVADRFLAWYTDGPFDIGMITADTLRAYHRGESWHDAGRVIWEERPEGQNAGNGSVMRCAPYAVAFTDDPDTLVEVSRQSSAITHYDPRCTNGCAILNCTIAGYLRGDDEPLQSAISRVESNAPQELVAALQPVPDGIDEQALETSGYVVHTLQTALYDAMTGESFEDAVVTAVNRGGDTDTLGAVTGAVAGARFGRSNIPGRWLEGLQHVDELARLGHDLTNLDLARST